VTSAVALIPARLASTRLPNKVLLAETGTPLVVHACRAAARAGSVARVAVAADHPSIVEAVRAAGFDAVLTSPDHPNGTSRLAEASTLLGLADEAVVVNVQGDEPEIAGSVVDAAIEALLGVPGADCGTVASPFAPGDSPDEPNIVKAVTTASPARPGIALYFSRAPVPFHRDGRPPAGEGAPFLRHVGIYAYRAGFLREYAGWAETPLERAERLEQLRILEHGRRIGVAIAEAPHQGIDTPEQYGAFVRRWRSGGLAGATGEASG